MERSAPLVMIVLSGAIKTLLYGKLAWLLYLFFVYALLIYSSVQGIRFILRKGSSIFKFKVEDRPKHYKLFDAVAKSVIALGIVIVTFFYTLPFTLDIPYIVAGKEKCATVLAVGHIDRMERKSVLPASILVRDMNDGTEFRVYLFTGEQKAEEVLNIEYLPFSKQAYVVQR